MDHAQGSETTFGDRRACYVKSEIMSGLLAKNQVGLVMLSQESNRDLSVLVNMRFGTQICDLL